MLAFWTMVCFLKIMNKHLILSRAFSVSIEIITWFLFFDNMVYPIDWLAYIEEALHSLVNSILIMVYMILLICYWSVCASWCFCFVFEDFCICVCQWYGSVIFFLFFLNILVLISGWWWPCRSNLGVLLPL